MSDQSYQHPDPASGQVCHETSGFLFSHPCEQTARYACQRCGKPICTQHVDYHDGIEICIQCSKQKPSKTTTKQPYGVENDDDYLDEDPYWYSTRHYKSYSWHDDVFTEADESVLIGNDDGDVEWENDMGAS